MKGSNKLLFFICPLFFFIAACECGWEYSIVPAIKTHSVAPDKSKGFPVLIVSSPRYVELFLDGQKIEWDEDICVECVVKIEMTPGQHSVAWEYSPSGYGGGNGMLEAEKNKIYMLATDSEYEKGELIDRKLIMKDSYGEKWEYRYKLKRYDEASLIVDICTGEIILGRAAYLP